MPTMIRSFALYVAVALLPAALSHAKPANNEGATFQFEDYVHPAFADDAETANVPCTQDNQFECPSTASPAIVITVDGLRFSAIIDVFGITYTDKDPYLKPAVEAMGIPELQPQDIVAFRWSRNPNQTRCVVDDLVTFLRFYHEECVLPQNKQLILVTNSWGTVLATLALLQDRDLRVDLLVTLSSPIGTTFTFPTFLNCGPMSCDCLVASYTVLWFAGIDPCGNSEWRCNLSHLSTVSCLAGFWAWIFADSISCLVRDCVPNVGKWLNFWAWGDVISGPLSSLPIAEHIEINDVQIDPGRNWLWSLTRKYNSTKEYHCKLSLQTGFMDECSEFSRNEIRSLVRSHLRTFILENLPGDVCESNDTNASACELGWLCDEAAFGGSIDPPGDRDWYRFFNFQRATSENYVELQTTSNLKACLYRPGNLPSDPPELIACSQQYLSLEGLLIGNYLISVEGTTSSVVGTYKLVINPSTCQCHTGDFLTSVGFAPDDWHESGGNRNGAAECGEYVSARLTVCSATGVGRMYGTVNAIDHVAVDGVEIDAGPIPAGGCDNTSSVGMQINPCDTAINAQFVANFEYRKDGYLFCEAKTFNHAFPKEAQFGFEVCDQSVSMGYECNNNQVFESGEEALVRFAVENRGAHTARRVECALAPFEVPGLVVELDNRLEWIPFNDIPPSQCSWPRQENSIWRVEAAEGLTGTYCTDVFCTYDGADEPVVFDDAVCVTVESVAWMRVFPLNVHDFGRLGLDETRELHGNIYNGGTMALHLGPGQQPQIVHPPCMDVRLVYPPWWNPIPPGASQDVTIQVSCSSASCTHEGLIDPPIDVSFSGNGCVAANRDRIRITGICSDEKLSYRIPTLERVWEADVSGEWMVWAEDRYGHTDIFACRTCSCDLLEDHIRITASLGWKGRPRISGNLVVWEHRSDSNNGDIHAFDLNKPHLGILSVSVHPANERLIGVDGNRIAFTRDYHVFTEQSNWDEASNLYIMQYDGNGGFLLEFTTGFTSNSNHQPMQSVYPRGDFAEGVLVFAQQELYWRPDALYWDSRDQHIQSIDYPTGQTRPARTCVFGWPSRITSAKNSFIYEKHDSSQPQSTFDEIWIWRNNNTCQRLFESFCHVGFDVLTASTCGDRCYVVYDYHCPQRPELYYRDFCGDNIERTVSLPNARARSASIDCDHVVWSTGENPARLGHAYLGDEHCESDLDCDDGNPCTLDTCSHGCCLNLPECEIDVDCNDGSFCNGQESCINGCCVDGTPPACDDGITCTMDMCDSGISDCVRIPVNSRCDDGNECTVCVCDPGNPLTDANGCLCTPMADGAPCFSDGFECTVSTCEDGVCIHVPDDAACDDGIFCNGQEECVAGQCEPGESPCGSGVCCLESCEQCGGLPVDEADGPLLYVGSRWNSSVSLFDASTCGTLAQVVPQGDCELSFVNGITFSPHTGNMLVASVFNRRIIEYRHDPTSCQAECLGNFATDIQPSGIVFGPDGHLYATDYSNNRVCQLDGVTGESLTCFTGCGLAGPSGPIWTPGGTLLVASQDTSAVIEFNPQSDWSCEVVANGCGLDTPVGLAFLPNGHLLASSFRTDSVIEFDLNADNTCVGTFIPSGMCGLERPQDVKLGPDGLVYVASQGTNSVLRFHLEGSPVEPCVCSTDCPLSGPTYLAFRCTTDEDCNDFNACTTNQCVNGACVAASIECDDGDPCNGMEWCDPVLGCRPGDKWESAEPDCNGTLSRVRNNVLTLWFDQNLPLAAGGMCYVQELLSDGKYGSDLSGQFEFDAEGNALRVIELGSVLENLKWYALRCPSGIGAIGPIEYHFTVLMGDANGDCVVNFADLGFINAGIPAFPPLSGANQRRDISGDGVINFADLGAANAYIPSFCASKPSGH